MGCKLRPKVEFSRRSSRGGVCCPASRKTIVSPRRFIWRSSFLGAARRGPWCFIPRPCRWPAERLELLRQLIGGDRLERSATPRGAVGRSGTPRVAAHGKLTDDPRL